MYSMSETNWGIHLPPSAWEQRKLGDMVEFYQGQTYSPVDIADTDGILVLRSSNVQHGQVVSNDDVHIACTVKLADNVRRNDIIVVVRNGSQSLIGKHALIRRDMPNTVIGAFMVGVRSEEPFFANALFDTAAFDKEIEKNLGATINQITGYMFGRMSFLVPSISEQRVVGSFFNDLDNLIALRQCKLRQIFQIIRVWSFVSVILAVLAAKHYVSLNTLLSQCKPPEVRRLSMSEQVCELNFADYYEDWIATYKEGAIRKPTMAKYKQSLKWVRQLAPNLLLSQLTRQEYQKLLNEYALVHEHQTTMDFHHQLKGSILDAVDEGLLARDPTRKAIIKGKQPTKKKPKCLSQLELHKLLTSLELTETLDWDWFILLVAKTGMRFSEALALTPGDFDFSRQMLTVNKTWDYKDEGGFAPTKNQSSVRKIQMDWQLVVQFSTMVRNLPSEDPIFVQKDVPVYNSTVNGVLERRCRKAQVPVISIHGLRHTHASLLLYAGVSMASVARRLGHSSMTTTQKTYLHIIQELENQDVDLVMRSLSSLV